MFSRVCFLIILRIQSIEWMVVASGLKGAIGRARGEISPSLLFKSILRSYLIIALLEPHWLPIQIIELLAFPLAANSDVKEKRKSQGEIQGIQMRAIKNHHKRELETADITVNLPRKSYTNSRDGLGRERNRKEIPATAYNRVWCGIEIAMPPVKFYCAIDQGDEVSLEFSF